MDHIERHSDRPHGSVVGDQDVVGLGVTGAVAVAAGGAGGAGTLRVLRSSPRFGASRRSNRSRRSSSNRPCRSKLPTAKHEHRTSPGAQAADEQERDGDQERGTAAVEVAPVAPTRPTRRPSRPRRWWPRRWWPSRWRRRGRRRGFRRVGRRWRVRRLIWYGDRLTVRRRLDGCGVVTVAAWTWLLGHRSLLAVLEWPAVAAPPVLSRTHARTLAGWSAHPI